MLANVEGLGPYMTREKMQLIYTLQQHHSPSTSKPVCLAHLVPQSPEIYDASASEEQISSYQRSQDVHKAFCSFYTYPNVPIELYIRTRTSGRHPHCFGCAHSLQRNLEA